MALLLLLLLPRLLALSLWCWTAQAWVLDYSCQENKQVETIITDAMKSVDKMVQNAQIALTAIIPNTVYIRPEYKKPSLLLSNAQILAFQNVFNTLFFSIDARTRPPLASPPTVDDLIAWQKLPHVFDRIRQFSSSDVVLREKDKYGELGPDQLIVYCNDKGSQRDVNNRRYHKDLDPANNGAIYSNDAWDVRTDCDTANLAAPGKRHPGNQAYTNSWDFSPQQIQICTSLLQYYTDPFTQFAHWNNGPPNGYITGEIPQDPFANDVLMPDTHMDLLGLLDHTLLHEIAHAARLGVNDVGTNPYGWQGAWFNGFNGEGHNNADNYAFFALASIMVTGRPGIAPNPFGMLQMV